MKKTLSNILAFLLIISMVSSAEINLSINSIEDNGDGNVIFDIYMKNEVPVSAFQFQLETDSTDIMSFRSFCSYENSYVTNFLTKSLCESNDEYDWIHVEQPDSGRADTSVFEVLPSIQGNIYGYSHGESIAIGEGLLTRVSASYDTTNINTPVNISFAKPNCDPNFDGILNVLDISIVIDAAMGTAVDSVEVYNCINISLDPYLDSPDQTVANEEYIDVMDVSAWIILSDYFGGIVELRINDSDGYKIEDVESIAQTWLVGTGISGCMNELACNFNENAISDDGNCEYTLEYYDCNDTCITDTDGDNVCDELEIVGCQDETACNYDETATDSNDCTYTDGICETCSGEEDGTGIVVDNDSDDDGVCDDTDICDGYNDTLDSDGDGTPDGCDLSIYEGIIPEHSSISSIYPNPFNPITSITYGIPEYTNVQVIIFDLSGNKVESLINESQAPGYHSINWNADGYPSGMYFVKMVAGNYVNTQKLMLVK